MRRPRKIARQLGSQQVITIASPTYLKERPLHALDDLARHSCICFRLPSSGRERPWGFQQGGRDVELHPRSRLTIDDAEGLVAAVCAGLGVTQIPSYVATRAMAEGAAVEVLAGLRPRPMAIHAVHASRKNVRLSVRAFIDFLTRIPELRHTESDRLGLHGPAPAPRQPQGGARSSSAGVQPGRPPSVDRRR